MAKFYQVQIETVYFTSTGLAGGLPAKLTVSGIEDLLTTVIGAAFPAIGGGAVLQLVPWTSGKQFEIAVETHLYTAQWEDLKDLINDALENDTSLTVQLSGETGNFTGEAKPFPVKPFSCEKFENGRIYKPVFRFITI